MVLVSKRKGYKILSVNFKILFQDWRFQLFPFLCRLYMTYTEKEWFILSEIWTVFLILFAVRRKVPFILKKGEVYFLSQIVEG